jgi:hypothetical protein
MYSRGDSNSPVKIKLKDIENSTQVMSDLFEDVKHNCSSNKTEIDTLKRRFEEGLLVVFF